MAKDFAFLFYVNDWAGGTQWMSRLQRAAYFDLLLYQVNNTSFSLEEVKCVLGTDFDATWGAIEKKLMLENGRYYNQKMREVLEERANFTESRRKNRLGKVKKTRKRSVKLVGDESEEGNVLAVIPKEEEFLSYCKETLGDKYAALEFSLKAKYEAWVVNKWKDGHDSDIVNWKTKIKNTIPYLKPEYTPAQTSIPTRQTPKMI